MAENGAPLDQAEPFGLYALRYAEHAGRKAGENFLNAADPHEAGGNLDYFIWLAWRGAEVWVIDTGFGPAAAARRGRRLLRTAREALARMGVDSHAVQDVIVTHLHYDHAGGFADFPAARFHLQVSEAAHASGPCMCDPAARAPFDVDNIVDYIRSLYAGRVIFHQGDRELAPGLWLHAVPGHSAGLQVVRVWTRRGWVVLASDATHFFANLARRDPFPVLWDEALLRQGFARLLDLAPAPEHIVPGHDPMVMRAWPAPAPELEGIAVRLDVAPLLNWQEMSA